MAEGVNNEPQKITRRQFLKFLGIGAAATAASAVTACSPNKENISEIDKKELTFKEIENGDKIPLNINGTVSEVVIVYAGNTRDSLYVRQRGGGNVVKSFEEGAETVRRLGEITDPTLYKVKGKNPDLGEEITVGVYPTTNGDKNTIEGRYDLGDSRLFGLKVIVNGAATENYGIDNPPLETNKNYNKNNSLSVPTFGEGLAIGRLVDGERNKVFYVEGYICDPRAVVLD